MDWQKGVCAKFSTRAGVCSNESGDSGGIPMQDGGSTQHGGIRLKQLRMRLGLTVRAVENLSRRLAAEKQNQDFFISRGWLSNVENGSNVPGLFKLYSLGAIYHTHWSSIFSYFGLNLSDFGRDQAMFAPPKTQLV